MGFWGAGSTYPTSQRGVMLSEYTQCDGSRERCLEWSFVGLPHEPSVTPFLHSPACFFSRVQYPLQKSPVRWL